jgi:predicted NAD/FAD-dependent oxidoreductase
VTVNLWFDADADIEIGGRLIGLVDGDMQWVFDKRAIFGARATHLALVASGAIALAALENEAIVEKAMADLQRAVPSAKSKRPVRSVVVRERRATFSLAATEPSRPPIDTGVPGFYMAGDWVDTGLPATIESAVLSGHRAADRLLGTRKAEQRC